MYTPCLYIPCKSNQTLPTKIGTKRLCEGSTASQGCGRKEMANFRGYSLMCCRYCRDGLHHGVDGEKLGRGG